MAEQNKNKKLREIEQRMLRGRMAITIACIELYVALCCVHNRRIMSVHSAHRPAITYSVECLAAQAIQTKEKNKILEKYIA